MNAKSKAKVPSEEKIDMIVVTQADDDSAWEEPVRVDRDHRELLLEQGDKINIVQ